MRNSYKESFLKKHGVKLSFMSPFIKAAAFALRDQPVINAVIDGKEIIYRDYVDISIAVATPKGLVVPVVRNVETMNYGDIEKNVAVLAEKVSCSTQLFLIRLPIILNFSCYFRQGITVLPLKIWKVGPLLFQMVECLVRYSAHLSLIHLNQLYWGCMVYLIGLLQLKDR